MEISDFNLVKVKNLKGEEVQAIEFFKAYQERWEETADPQREDEEYFLDENEAKEYAEAIQLNVGFFPTVLEIRVQLSELKDLEEEFEYEDIPLNTSAVHINEVWTGETSKGENITGSIIIEWTWEKHIGYARNLMAIGRAGEHPFSKIEYEEDLITGNEESVFGDNYSVLLTTEEIQEDYLMEQITEEINQGHWKWNYFKNNPNTVDYSFLHE